MAVFISPTGIECSSADPNFYNSGLPYNLKSTGTTTTDSVGNVYVYIGNWSWSTWQSFKRVSIVWATFWNDSNKQVASNFMYVGSGNRVINMAQDAFVGSSAWGAATGFTANSGTGARYIYLTSASANTVYNYEFRALNINSDFDGYTAI